LLSAAPAGQALAQQNGGGTINIGGSIAGAVTGAVSGIATNSSASGGARVEHNDIAFGDQEGLAVSDASGGNHNLSAKSK
jgi:hypothetical protein